MALAVRYLVLLLGLFVIHAWGASHIVTVDANDEICFFEDLHRGQPIGVTYQVTDGGFLDIDVQIRAPDGSIMFEITRSSEDNAAVQANMEGRHRVCFSNKMSTMTTKEVMFTINSWNNPEPEAMMGTTDEDHQRMDNMLKDLMGKLRTAKDEHAYMAMRALAHRTINENTHSRVLQWAVFQLVVVVVMSLGQIIYLKRFFEQRQMV